MRHGTGVTPPQAWALARRRVRRVAALEWVDWFNTRRLLDHLATCRRRSAKLHTVALRAFQPWALDSRHRVFRNPGRFSGAGGLLLVGMNIASSSGRGPRRRFTALESDQHHGLGPD
jgi:hypothetical protein